MTRLEALKAADEYVQSLASQKNERGYAIHTLIPQQRVTEVLRVAEFLLRGDIDY